MNRARAIILVVEDEVSLRDILQEELCREGYKVVVARDGAEGLVKLQDVEPDVIICDRAMPGMTGYELLERIRGIYPQYRKVPFIFLTALTDAWNKLAAQELRPFAYLEKPLDFNILLRTIERALIR